MTERTARWTAAEFYPEEPQMPDHATLFHCPYPAALSPDVERARTHTLGWGRQMGIITSAREIRRVDAYRLDTYSARICPSATGDGLELLNDWVLWGTLLDDQLETRDPDAIRASLDQMTSLLAQENPSRFQPGAHPFTVSLSDLWTRTLALSQTPRHRTVVGLTRWLRTYTQDAAYRRDAVWLTLERYLAHRIWAGAVPPYMELTEAVTGCDVPDALTRLSVVEAMRRTAAEHVCIVNDVYSVEREQSRGDVGNLLLVLEHHQGCPRDESLRQAERLANERMSAFGTLEAQLLTTVARGHALRDDEHTTAKRMALGLRSWMRGNLDWHRNLESSRYEERGQQRPAQDILRSPQSTDHHV